MQNTFVYSTISTHSIFELSSTVTGKIIELRNFKTKIITIIKIKKVYDAPARNITIVHTNSQTKMQTYRNKTGAIHTSQNKTTNNNPSIKLISTYNIGLMIF